MASSIKRGGPIEDNVDPRGRRLAALIVHKEALAVPAGYIMRMVGHDSCRSACLKSDLGSPKDGPGAAATAMTLRSSER